MTLLLVICGLPPPSIKNPSYAYALTQGSVEIEQKTSSPIELNRDTDRRSHHYITETTPQKRQSILFNSR